MGYSKTLRILLVTMTILVLLSNRKSVKATASNGGDNTHLPRNRAIRFPSRISPQYARTRPEPVPDFMVDDDDLMDLSKRQSDDYGHMRFGKREFDDYGHMRFGRAGSD